MTHATTPNHSDLAAQLPAGAYHYLMHTLRKTLPDLLTNSPEDIVRRDQSAMARVAALCPANIAEAEVAASHVAHAEHAKACLRDAKTPEISLLGVMKCRAQAASMSRQADSSLRMLLRMQAARQKIEANPETRDRAAWSEHCTLNLLAEALSPPPPHLSRSAGEVGSRCEPGEGAAAKAKQPQSESQPPAPPSSSCTRIDPRSGSKGKGAPPTTPGTPNHDTPVSPTRAAMIRLLRQWDDPNVQPLQALAAASRDNANIAAKAAPHFQTE